MGSQPKTVVITGGSRGIGLATAQAFLAQGDRVVLASRSPEHLRQAVAYLWEFQGGRRSGVYAAAINVTDEAAVRELFRRTTTELGRVDILVNAAGTLVRGNLAYLDLDAWNRSIAVNLTGVFLCSREAARAMLVQPPDPSGLRGHIIQVVSGAGEHAWPGQGAYAAAKHGVMGLSSTLRDEVRERGIKVSDVLPGMVATDMTDLPDFAGRHKLDPADVARAIVGVAGASSNVMITRMDVRHRLPK